MYRALHDGWTLRAEGKDIAGVPADVPGCVHTDLLAAGLIDDPYQDDNEARLSWIGRTDWTYETTFDWTFDRAPGDADRADRADRADLSCEGLDTVATVVLNGVEIGSTANMHRSYRWPVRELLREGANTLRVRFDSPYAYAEKQRIALGERPGAYAEPYNFIRKTACNFGWDWGPTLVTSGIWQPIGIHTWSQARLAEVRPLVTVRDGVGRVDVHVSVERADARPLTVTAEIAGVSEGVRLEAGQTTAVVGVEVPEPELWWPRGYGEQPLYPLVVRLGEESWEGEVGFRTVELETEAFRLVINGRPVFVKGFNWIPDDCFPNRVTPERLAERFGQAVEAGANALRVWGGGRYESEDFYRLADRTGLLVWQDFPFACAAYPEEEPFRGEVEAEARQQVARLAAHPSLVLWCGNNENIEGEQHWDWREPLAGRSWGAGFYYDLLPKIVTELDPTRPYWPGSPYSGSPELDVHDPERGTVHIWTVWGTHDYTHYAAYTPRFVAEFGFQGPPTYATLRRTSSDEPLTAQSSHQKAEGGDAKLLRGLGEHLPEPRDFDDWHYYTQVNQARALAFGIERFRALSPYCMGTIVWQLNDCWPVSSWAAVDGDGRRKPLWYGMRRVYAERLLTFTGGGLAVVNDTDRPWSGEVAVTRLDLTGAELAAERAAVTAEPRSVAHIELPDALTSPSDAAHELLAARLDGERALSFFTEDPETAFPPARFDAEAEQVPGGVRLHITARTVLRELAVFPDRLDPSATVDDQLVTLLPGESRTFHITTDQALDAAALTAFPVLRCVNETKP